MPFTKTSSLHLKVACVVVSVQLYNSFPSAPLQLWQLANELGSGAMWESKSRFPRFRSRLFEHSSLIPDHFYMIKTTTTKKKTILSMVFCKYCGS